MSEITHFNSSHLEYLTPLLNWRIMDLERLRRESFSGKKYNNFAKIIRNLEKAKVVNAYRHPFTRKKYIYFSSLGERYLEGEENATAVSKDTLIHDIKVSEIAQDFFERNWVTNVLLEHKLQNKRNFKSTSKVIPDAVFEIETDKYCFKLGFELEITRKSKSRILEKVKEYIMSEKYDYMIYFFSKKSIMQSYQNLIREKFNNYSDRFMYFYDNSLTALPTDLENINGIFRGEEVKLDELFKKLSKSKQAVK